MDKKDKNYKKRYYLLDTVRAAAILNMIIYHFLYDTNIIFENDTIWYRKKPVIIWEFAICSVFIFISGISFNLSSRPLKRGIILNFWGLVITVATGFFIPDEIIWFGILSFLGCAWIIAIAFKKVKINPYAGVIFSIFLFILTYKALWNGYVGIGEVVFFKMPNFLYNNIFTIPFGFRCEGFHSSDFFPIFPWFFLFMSGNFTWEILDKKIIRKKAIERILSFDVPILGMIGRKSLLIYIIHQPICFFAAFILNLINCK